MKAVDGGKNGPGVFQTIINQIPPHDFFAEVFCRSCAITRRKRRASTNVVVDIDRAVTEMALRDPELAGCSIVNTDALTWLNVFKQECARFPSVQALIYCDPPYLMEARSIQRDIYRHEFGSAGEHKALLDLLKELPCMVMLSGYRSELYDYELCGWRRIDYQTTTRGGPVIESLWCNFPEPTELHDYKYFGSDYRERTRIKRKVARWKNKLSKMSLLERAALIEALAGPSASSGAAACSSVESDTDCRRSTSFPALAAVSAGSGADRSANVTTDSASGE